MDRTFGILGTLDVRVGDASVGISSRKQRLVLARLLVADGPVSEDELIDVLWSTTPPTSALSSLRAHVSRLRTALAAPDGADVIVHGDGGYRLGAGRIDARRFEDGCEAGRRAARAGDIEHAHDRLGAALSLWRGEALTGFRFEPFAQPTIARLETLRVQAREDRLAFELELGDPGAAIAELEELALLHPLRERVTELLMVALARSGRTADALATYRRARAVLRSELGLDPSPALQQLHGQLLRGDAPPATGTIAVTSPAVTGRLGSAAATAWRRVIEAVDLPDVDDRVQADLLLSRADGLRRAGRVENARGAYAAAVRLTSTTGRHDQLAAAVIGLVGPPEDSLSDLPLDEPLLERAMLRLSPDHPALAFLRARLAVALVDRGEPDRGHALLQAALDGAERQGDQYAATYALRARHRVWFDPDELAARRQSAERLLDIGRSAGDLEVMAWGHRWCAISALEGGAIDRAEVQLEQLDRLLDTHSDAFHRWFVVSRRAGLRLLRDPSPDADAAVMEALALTDRVRSEYTTFVAGTLLLASHWVRGRWKPFQQLTGALAAAHPLVAALQPLAQVKLGAHDEARRAFDELADDHFAAVLDADRIGVIRLVGLAALAETAACLGDADRAAELYERLRPYAGALAVVHPGVTAVATIDHCLGRLAATLGADVAARDHLSDALTWCRRYEVASLAPATEEALRGLDHPRPPMGPMCPPATTTS